MSRRVLVCDDEPQILRALRVVLREAGFEVVPAATAEEALDRAAVQPPDAAILDLVLPDGDGIAVCKALREWIAWNRIAWPLAKAPALERLHARHGVVGKQSL